MKPLLFLFVVVFTLGCERKQTVSGQIDLRSKDGQPYKLGFSKVLLVDAERGADLMAQAMKALIKEQAVVLNDLELALNEEKRSRVQEGITSKVNAGAAELSRRGQFSEAMALLDNHRVQLEQWRDAILRRSGSRGLKSSSIKTLYERVDESLKTDVLASATPDTEGRFTLRNPRNAKAIVLAFGTHDTPAWVDQHLWFLPAEATLTLNRDNLVLQRPEFRNR